MNPEILDWTEGTEGIALQLCGDCHHAWYFRRDFCPACGSRTLSRKQASGLGTVHAVTLVTRAPSETLRAYAPYAIALVDADEGFRLMAHVAPEARIGDRVRATFHAFGSATVPLFVLES